MMSAAPTASFKSTHSFFGAARRPSVCPSCCISHYGTLSLYFADDGVGHLEKGVPKIHFAKFDVMLHEVLCAFGPVCDLRLLFQSHPSCWCLILRTLAVLVLYWGVFIYYSSNFSETKATAHTAFFFF